MAFLLWERRARDRALAAIPIRIHVNGTRGQVHRDAARRRRPSGSRHPHRGQDHRDRAADHPAGRQRAVRAAPRARQHPRTALAAARGPPARGRRRSSSSAWPSTPTFRPCAKHQMIRSTIGVVTNVRLDHAEVMGRDSRRGGAGARVDGAAWWDARGRSDGRRRVPRRCRRVTRQPCGARRGGRWDAGRMGRPALDGGQRRRRPGRRSGVGDR